MQKSDIPAVNRILKREYHRRYAPVIDLIRARTEDPFRILVATILSARTKDETTSTACDRLFKVVRRPADLKTVSLARLEKLIFPVGFYRTKARHLKELPVVLADEFNGRIPSTIEELCQLPGVGRKTANLVMSAAFDKPAICVDVHVHRISNRLGLLKTANPFESEMALRRILPIRYWKTWNSYLVSYGQSVCRPIGPHCPECQISKYCKSYRMKNR
ncbi:MAG: endonuclease III [Lentisphaerales bacterium]|jgi:endonuclease III|nr:MAG: endonuclease III [Lentisphaerales bacterium]